MKYVQLNKTDLNVSRICLGTAGFGDKLGQEKSFEILDAFVRAGGNFIDTANVYCKWLDGHGNCSEQIIGKWLKDRGAEGKVIVATKGAHYSFEDPGRSRVNREDIRADLTAQSVQDLVEPVFQEAGDYQELKSAQVTGSTEGEEHGIAQLLCIFSQEKVSIRVAFDPDMELIGLSAGLQKSSWSLSNLVNNFTGLFRGD